MASEDFEKEEYKNWVRGAMGLKYLQEGLQDFVEDKVKECHEKTLKHIVQNIPAGKPKLCCQCQYKQNAITKCPNDICNKFYDAIKQQHSFKNPMWKNTNSTEWCSDPWMYAKCFQTTPNQGSSADKTDAPGLLSVLINNTEMWNFLACSDMKSKQFCIFQRARNVRNEILHNPKQEIDYLMLGHYLNTFMSVLQDGKCLINSNGSKTAIKKLLQLQKNQIIISPNDKAIAEKMREDALTELENAKIKAILAVKKEGDGAMANIGNAKTEAVSAVKEEGDGAMAGIEHAKAEAISDVKEEGDRVIREVKAETEVTAAKGRKLQREEEYQEKKQQLKEDLAEFYRGKHSTIPLAPLFEGKDTPLVDFYLMPGMNIVEMVNGKEGKTAIKSLSEVYKSGDEYSKEIYVTADAGFGKTAFSKYLTVLWCQAQFPDKNHTEYLKKEDVNGIRKFQFLFLVLLRYSSYSCRIDDMIFGQIVKSLSSSASYDKQFLQKILKNEKCLVVLDGLDEWTHPNLELPIKKKCEEIQKSIPHRSARKNCTYMTTTRPWKLSTLQLNTQQLDKKIELTNLDRKSALELTTRALKKIRDIKDETDLEIWREEAEKLMKTHHDFEQVSVPLLLMYVICLWCDNIPIGQTRCGLYTRIIELLLSRTNSKFKDKSQAHKSQAQLLQRVKDKNQCVIDIPQCFSEQEHCKAYFTFLTCLGELAFQTLFSETKENRLVFDISIAGKCLKEDFLELGGLTGIITEDLEQTKLTSQKSKTSFSHKTVQEFFAALYISTCSDQDKVLTKVLSLCNSIQDILDLSNVLHFISGINAETFSLLSNKLMEVINNDEITSKYRSTIEPVYWRGHPLLEIQRMIVSCMTEIPDNKNVSFCLQDFFFDKYYKCLQRLAVNNKTNIKSIYICYDVCQNVSEVIDRCELSDPEIHCQKIHCERKCIEEEILRLLSTSVKCLYIAGIQEDNESKDAHCCLTDEQCKIFYNSSQLETIQIKKFMMEQRIQPSIASHKFLNSIINVKSIKQIELTWLYCSDHGRSCPGFNFDLSKHPELRKLELSLCLNFSLCDMKEESLLSHNMRNIELVALTYVEMSSLLLRHLVEIIKQLEHKVTVTLKWCTITPREEFVNIIEEICRSQSFDVKKDDRYNVGDVFEFVTKK